MGSWARGLDNLMAHSGPNCSLPDERVSHSDKYLLNELGPRVSKSEAVHLGLSDEHKVTMKRSTYAVHCRLSRTILHMEKEPWMTVMT